MFPFFYFQDARQGGVIRLINGNERFLLFIFRMLKRVELFYKIMSRKYCFPFYFQDTGKGGVIRLNNDEELFFPFYFQDAGNGGVILINDEGTFFSLFSGCWKGRSNSTL